MEKKRNNVVLYSYVISVVMVVCVMALILSVLPATVLHAEESSVKFTSADKNAGKITAYLYKPDSGSGPFAAVVIMHGGGGVHGWTTDFASTVSGWGYVTLVIDSYGSRNIRSTDEIGHRKGAFYQIADVYGGYRFLSKLDFVDSNRIAILGFSRGGHTTLNAIGEEQSLPYYVREGLARPGDFAAAVAIYPHCKDQENIVHKAPVLILIGDRDREYNLDCSADVVNRSKASGLKSALHIYRGVTHSYFSKRIRNPRKEHEYDPSAVADTERRTKAFLAKHLR